MELGPILRALSRNKTGALLIALQIAVTMCVVVNAWFMIEERVRLAARPSGVDEAALFHIRTRGYSQAFNPTTVAQDDLALLRGMGGVTDALAVNTVPLSGSGWSMGLQLEPGMEEQAQGAAVYFVDDHGINTFGIELVAGRDFTPADLRIRTDTTNGWPDKTIISEHLAKELWPDDSPLNVIGRTVYINNFEPMTVIGVMARLQAPWNGSSIVEDTMLVPDQVQTTSMLYVIRTEPGQRDAMMPVVEEALARAQLGRIVEAPESMTETRQLSYALDMGLAKLLIAIMVLLLAITSLGIVGLASFSVQRRTRQIGTRRALGATKGDILRYFVIENFFITTAGVVLGAIMTIAFNAWLVEAVGFPQIDVWYIPIGMVVLWIIGLIAVFGPARRASSVPPALAARTV